MNTSTPTPPNTRPSVAIQRGEASASNHSSAPPATGALLSAVVCVHCQCFIRGDRRAVESCIPGASITQETCSACAAEKNLHATRPEIVPPSVASSPVLSDTGCSGKASPPAAVGSAVTTPRALVERCKGCNSIKDNGVFRPMTPEEDLLLRTDLSILITDGICDDCITDYRASLKKITPEIAAQIGK